MIRTARLVLTACAGAALLTAAAPAHATALRGDFQPHAVTGAVITQGADGTERTLMCPPDENVLAGGYALSAPAGSTLDSAPADVLTSRPTSDATGWIVAVKKSLENAEDDADPADLTLQIVCTEGESTPGA